MQQSTYHLMRCENPITNGLKWKGPLHQFVWKEKYAFLFLFIFLRTFPSSVNVQLQAAPPNSVGPGQGELLPA